jgi:hypothetical protein
MKPATSRPSASGSPGVGWIAGAAAAGAIGAWLVLSAGTPAKSPAAAAATQPYDAVAAPTNPWPAPSAPASAPTEVAAPVRVSPPANSATDFPPDAPLDDASLARRAREMFGFDCPAIVDRGPRRSGHIDVTCSNGERLRVHVMDGANPTISRRR